MLIKSIEELEKGDIILIQGIGNDICIVTVKKVTKDGLIIPLEFGGIDYAPEDPEQIIVIIEAGEEKCSLGVYTTKINILKKEK